MNFTIYGDDSKGLLKLDPRTKLLIFFASSFLSLHSFDLLTLLIFGTVLCGLLALCGKPWLALKCEVVFAISCYLKYITSISTTGAAYAISILIGILSILLFAFPVVVSFLMLSQTTRISHFLTAFQTMHLPQSIVIPIAVLFRFIPAVQEEWQGIRKAMAFRGIELNLMSIIRAPAKAIEYALIPLLFSSVSVMEELAAAAMARGMDSEQKRTSYETVKMRAADYIVIIVILVLVISIIKEGKWGM